MKNTFSNLKLQEAIEILKEIGDGSAANDLLDFQTKNEKLKNKRLFELPESDKLKSLSWRGTEHAFGFIEVDDDGDDFYEIKPATTIKADQALKGEQINIKLGSLYTMNYPGWGRHNVLMHFKCKHADNNTRKTQLIEFEQKFKSREGEGAGNIGDFIFLGLKVPSNGLQFQVQTVNVSNDSDDEALKILDSDTIKNGLDLVNASFSTLAPFSKMAKGVLQLLLNRNKNKIVQQFTLGFDFNEDATEVAKLRIGTYVAVQAKKDSISWNNWIYKRSIGLIVSKTDNTIRLPYNHITFNVTKYA